MMQIAYHKHVGNVTIFNAYILFTKKDNKVWNTRTLGVIRGEQCVSRGNKGRAVGVVRGEQWC